MGDFSVFVLRQAEARRRADDERRAQNQLPPLLEDVPPQTPAVKARKEAD